MDKAKQKGQAVKDKGKELHKKATAHAEKHVFGEPFGVQDEETKQLLGKSMKLAGTASCGTCIIVLFQFLGLCCVAGCWIGFFIKAFFTAGYQFAQCVMCCVAPCEGGYASKNTDKWCFLCFLLSLLTCAILCLVWGIMAMTGGGGVGVWSIAVLISALATAACYAFALFYGVKLHQRLNTLQVFDGEAPTAPLTAEAVQPDVEKGEAKPEQPGKPEDGDWPKDENSPAPANNAEQ